MNKRKYILIANPLSGSYNDKKLNKIIKTLEDNDMFIVRYNLKKDQKIGEIIKDINSDEINNIILAFGDGTINSACNSLLQRDDYYKFNIYIIPMGTANILSMELNCDSIKKSVNAILKNKIKKLHIGKANNRLFVLMASAGFDSYAVFNVDENLKSKIGKLTYVYEFLKILFKMDFKKITTTIDNEKYENILTCVSNGKYYGVKIPITNSIMTDNIFDVIIIKKFNIFSIIKYLITKKSNKNIIYMKANNVDIISNTNDYPVQLDGDYFFNLPINITTTDKYLNFAYN